MNNDNFNIVPDEIVVLMAQEGSSTACEFLIRKYKELIKIKASNYFIAGGDRDDIVQEGMIGAFKAIKDFDIDKEASFKTFLELCVDRQIKTAVTGANRQKHKILNESISLNQQGAEEKESEIDYAEQIASNLCFDNPEEILVLLDAFSRLNGCKEPILSKFETQVWDLILKGKNSREIAQTLNKEDKTIDNAIQRIKGKLKKALGR